MLAPIYGHLCRGEFLSYTMIMLRECCEAEKNPFNLIDRSIRSNQIAIFAATSWPFDFVSHTGERKAIASVCLQQRVE